MSAKMKAKRPYLASECDSVQMCEMYRQQVMSMSGDGEYYHFQSLVARLSETFQRA